MIREVALSDAGRIAEIYAPYVENTAISFESEAPTADEMASRIEHYTENYPWIVYEAEGRVVGYAYASAFRQRKAYSPTAEMSIYFDKNYCSHGYGTVLLAELISRVRQMGYYTAIACITWPNEKSERLFKNAGFSFVGIYKNVGYKYGEWRSVMEYILPLREYD